MFTALVPGEHRRLPAGPGTPAPAAGLTPVLARQLLAAQPFGVLIGASLSQLRMSSMIVTI